MAIRKDAVGLFWEDIPEVKVSTKKLKVKAPPPHRFWEEPDYLPNYAEARDYKGQFFSDAELMEAQAAHHELLYDIESYPNYFLIAFKSRQNGKLVYFELAKPEDVLDIPKLRWVLENFLCIGFNSIKYDAPMLAIALTGASTDQLYWATEQLIVHGVRASDLLKACGAEKLQFNHIDLIEVAPLMASLKTYGGRIHVPRMQDLPFRPGTILSQPQQLICRWYCFNDLQQTEMLLDELRTQLELRVTMSVEYKQDLRSKSDAQIAEAVIAAEVAKINGYRCKRPEIPEGTVYKYKTPSYMKFNTPLMQKVLFVVQQSDFVVNHKGEVEMPEGLKKLTVNIGSGSYTMGIGGLHSTEKCATHIGGNGRRLKDRDVVSFYPMIILLQRLFPKHLGEAFLKVFKTLVTRRIKCKTDAQALEDEWRAKAAALQQKYDGKKIPEHIQARIRELTIQADVLKIVINGSYGKLGSMWSILFAPDLMIQVTLTGQLSLFLLIERLELAGISVVSANTDGVVSSFTDEQDALFLSIIKQWEKDTGFQTEETEYSGLYSRDVNNYIAITTSGKVKTKGAYGLGDKSPLAKNPTGKIISDAVIAYLKDKTPLWKTIADCKDIRQFCYLRNVTGGGIKTWDDGTDPNATPAQVLTKVMEFGFIESGTDSWYLPDSEYGKDVTLRDAYKIACTPRKSEYLGKVVRWYYATGVEGCIVYAKSGNKVPKSEGAMPLMVLPESLPLDVDYAWYLREAEKMLVEIGYA